MKMIVVITNETKRNTQQIIGLISAHLHNNEILQDLIPKIDNFTTKLDALGKK